MSEIDRQYAHGRVNAPDEDCSGDGKCHGCMSWCAVCGDVTTMCDSDDTEHEDGGAKCNQHRCDRCCKMLSRDDHDAERDAWKRWCADCRARCITCRCLLPEGVEYQTCAPCKRQSRIESLERELLAENRYGIDDANQNRQTRIVDEIRRLTETP